ncbi:MAG TPA: peptidylprolyl isomerase [Candidatus Pacebacteria bacterium]|nr:peptidylprolyl isomerase [Candidatus Paceibacterota bacterium]
MIVDQNKTYNVTLHTSEGNITISMDIKNTPLTANNFISLAKSNFYDGVIFHRAIKGFMIQGGDPRGDGTGGPGYQFDDEEFTGEYLRGTVAMANAGPNTNGSQFFIMHQDYALQPNYVIFGHVISGMEVVDKIAEAEVSTSFSGEMSKPINPVSIDSVSVEEK